MASYEVRYQCGHTGTVNLFGPTRERERKLEWLAGLPCRERQKAREEQQERERTEEMGLPELTGSEKQVSWATGIRLEKLDLLARRSEDIQARVEGYVKYLEREGLSEDRIAKAKSRLEAASHNLWLVTEIISRLSGITEAHWWIENRDADAEGLAQAFKALQEAEMAAAIEEEAKPTMVVMEPEEKKTSTVATLRAYDREVLIQSDRDEHIRLTVKEHGFSWDSSRTVWRKPVTELTGPARDLGPDTARILLEAGIPVKAYPEVAEAVQAGTYEPESHRWIEASREGDRLAIRKAEGVTDYPEGKPTWKNDYILVSPSHWREVREFAAMNGYRTTRAAEKMLRKEEDATVTVRPAAKAGEAAGGTDALKAILESSRDILDDLKEEED